MKEFQCTSNAFFLYNFTFNFLQQEALVYTEEDVTMAKDFYIYSLYVYTTFLNSKLFGKKIGFVKLTEFS